MGFLKVKEVYDPELIYSEVVGPNESLAEVIRKFAKRADLLGLFVADQDGRLLGVVSLKDILNFAKFHLGGRDLTLSEIRTFIGASQVKDIMHSWDISVKLGDDVLKALNIMLERNLIDVPVVDDDGRLIGDVELSQILLRIIE